MQNALGYHVYIIKRMSEKLHPTMNENVRSLILFYGVMFELEPSQY